MKTETYQQKMLEALGLGEQVAKIKVKQEEKQGKFIGITEEEIQQIREGQGIVYFLQAPELFSLKTCKHCGSEFLVSRLYVALCSYTCIQKSLEEMGLQWRKGKDLETIIEEIIPEIYEGNEPIWIRNVERLRKILETKVPVS